MLDDHKALWFGLAIVAVASSLMTATTMSEEILAMNGSQWLLLLVAIVAGYVAARLFPQPGKMFGLP